MNEYDRITSKEAVVKSAQMTINVLCDYMRETIGGSLDEYSGDTNAIYFSGSAWGG